MASGEGEIAAGGDGKPEVPYGVDPDNPDKLDEDVDIEDGGATRSFMGTVIIVCACGSMGFNIVNMYLAGTSISYAAGVIALAIAPIVLYYQRELDDKDALRALQNALRNNVNGLFNANNQLAMENGRLKDEVGNLKECEGELAGLAEQQGFNIEKLVGLVKENGILLKELRLVQEARMVNSVMGYIIAGDRDGNADYDDREIKILNMKLKRVDGLIVNEKLLIERLVEDGSLTNVFALLKDAGRDDLPLEEKVFHFDFEAARNKYSL